MAAETGQERSRRRRQRTLFDGVAQLYQARKPPPNADAIAASGLFDQPVERTHERRTTVAADTVIGVENTRAISLSWSDDVREEFTGELRSQLGSLAEVPLTLHTSLTMARVR